MMKRFVLMMVMCCILLVSCNAGESTVTSDDSTKPDSTQDNTNITTENNSTTEDEDTTVFGGAKASATENMGKQNPLNGLRVGFYGDSICAANRENRIGWAGRVGNANQMIWDNNGQGGWAVSDCRGFRKTLYYQLTTTNIEDYEMIILHGGTNDAWDNVSVGVMTEEYLDYNYDPTTFAGGLERAFAYVRKQNPNAIVGYIINFKFINAAIGATTTIDGRTTYVLNNMQEYVDMTKKICRKWKIPYLDLYSNDELTDKLHPTNTSNVYLTKYLYDFIHPTSLGYDLLSPYVENFMLELIATSNTTKEQITVTETVGNTNETNIGTAEQSVIEPNVSTNSGCEAFSCAGIAASTVALSSSVLICRRKHKKTNDKES